MFQNIGSKIKTYAIVVCVLGIVISVITGFVFVVIGVGDSFPMLSFVGILVGALGALFSWLSSFVLLGYGELIENTKKTNELLKIIATQQK